MSARLEAVTDSEVVAAAELVHVRKRRTHFDLPVESVSGPMQASALALSGGGIRSAVFCLGVLQALVQENLLRRFDYLSTVSGGGYIGSSLTWFTSTFSAQCNGVSFGVQKPTEQKPTDMSGQKDAFPYGIEAPYSPRSESGSDHRLEYLRGHGRYLAPGHGITLLSGVGAVLRGIFLNLLVWLPLTAFVLSLMMIVSHLVYPDVRIQCLFAMLSQSTSCQPEDPGLTACGCGNRSVATSAFWLLLLLALFIAGAVAIFWIIYSFLTCFKRGSVDEKMRKLHLIRAAAGNEAKQGVRYGFRRTFDRSIGWPLLAIAALLIVGTLPIIADAFGKYLGSVGPIGILSGAGSALIMRLNGAKTGAGDGGFLVKALAPVAALLTLYGVLLLSYWVACIAGGSPTMEYWLILFTVVAAFTGFFVNLNYISLHRYYRDRLMEAFMPNLDKEGKPHRKFGATNADPAPLSAMCPSDPSDPPQGPYHIINTHLVVTQTDDRKLLLRGGDSFILSPRYCGSQTTGWFKTEEFMDDGMTLPTAMAISGAAVNPSAASGGVGPSRNRFVSIVMALFNVRLGYWVPNPKACKAQRNPNHFNPGLREFFDWAKTTKDRTLQLSDGGHFDNLGVYELIRRKARLILACDASADPLHRFAELQSLLVRIEADFGTKIDFGAQQLDPLMLTKNVDYPDGVKTSPRSYVLGDITYDNGKKGTLIYLMATLVQGFNLELFGYKASNAEFPDDSTLDQFFDEGKFEAYRGLGYAAAQSLLKDDSVRDLLNNA